MDDIRLSRSWDRQIEDDLPDCRVSHSNRDKNVVYLGRMPMDMVFCADCGAPSGAATMHTPHIFFVCGDCVGRAGPPPGCHEIEVPHVPLKDVIGHDLRDLWKLDPRVKIG